MNSAIIMIFSLTRILKDHFLAYDIVKVPLQLALCWGVGSPILRTQDPYSDGVRDFFFPQACIKTTEYILSLLCDTKPLIHKLTSENLSAIELTRGVFS